MKKFLKSLALVLSVMLVITGCNIEISDINTTGKVEQSTSVSQTQPESTTAEQTTEQVTTQPTTQIPTTTEPVTESTTKKVTTTEATTKTPTTQTVISPPETSPPSSVAPTNNQSSSGKKMVALTFDDGPGKYTNELLDTLAKYDAKATFFVLGCNVNNYKSTIKRMHNEGHEIGNHTYNHPKLTKASDATIKKEFNDTNTAIENIIGKKPTLFRSPYGAMNSHVNSFINVPIIHWNLDSLDWKLKNTDKVYNYVKGKVSGGDVILMHDIHETSVDAVALLLKDLSNQGYEFVTVSELFNEYGPSLGTDKVYCFVSGSTWK